jgi:hypothetical protein
MKKRIIPCLTLICCLSTVYAGYENGGVITTYVGDVDCVSGLLEVKNGGAADLLEMQNFSRLKVWSTSPLGYMGGIWDIKLVHNSHLDYYGGWTDELTIGNYATADLYGGRIDGISSYQYIGWRGDRYYGEQHINIHCQPGWAWKEENGVIRGITGVWWDDTSFDIRFTTNGSDVGFDLVWENINVIVPEPAAVVLLSFGAVITAIKKRRVAK